MGKPFDCYFYTQTGLSKKECGMKSPKTVVSNYGTRAKHGTPWGTN